MNKIGTALAVLSAAAGVHAAGAAAQPNIVLILVDDMPWFGTPVRMDADLPASAMDFCVMPNVKKLAEQGMTFRNARASAGMCAPSRCSIQTGMMAAHHLYSGNGGFGPKTDGSVEYISERGAPLLTPEPQGNIRFPSIGDVLKPNGYTTAHFGKWHLYGGGPAKHGYDESDGETDNKSAKDVVSGYEASANPKQIFSITQSGVSFIERQAKTGKPFYLQLSHYATHAKYAARPATLEKTKLNPVFKQITEKRVLQNATELAAMAEDLDTGIGMVLKAIEDAGIASNTYVIFTSDNGYRDWNQGFDPLRGAKWWNWDAGLRVPLIVRGPGIKPGSRCDVNVVNYDFLPTFADLATASASLPKAVDGVSFKPLLLGQPVPDSYVNRSIYFHYPHYRTSAPSSALVIGQMKLLHFYDHPDENFLFDLSKDLGEKNNLTSAYPEKADQMYKQLMSGLNSVGAYFPKPNPSAKADFKVYNPNDLSDAGAGGDDDEGDGGGGKKKPKAGKKKK